MELELKEKWKKQQSTIRLLMFTFVCAIIEFLISVPSVMRFILNPQRIISQTPPPPHEILIPPLLDSPTFVGLYFVIPIIFCIATSLSFYPKRMVSPLNIQILTFGMIVIFSMLITYSVNPLITIHLKDLFAVMMYFFAIIISFGFGQLFLVKLVIGMNGTKDDINQKTYRISLSFEKVESIILDKEFKETWYFKTKRDHDKIIMKSKFFTTENILIGLQKDPENKNYCIFSTASYEAKFYQIQSTRRIRNKQDLVINEIKKKIGELALGDPVKIDYEISDDIENLALGQTQNKLLFFTRMEGIHKKVLIGLAIVFALVSIVHFAGPLSTDSYLTSIILIGIAIVTDLIPILTKTSKNSDF